MKRILVATKYRYLGDTIVATPFLRRLKEGMPDAFIALLSGPAIPTLLQGCPYVDEIVTFTPDKEPRGHVALARDLRSRHFDTAFLINRSLMTALIAKGARIPLRIGFNTEFRGPLLSKRVRYDWSKPDRDCALDLLRAVSIPAEPALPELWVTEEERATALARLNASGIQPDRLLVGMQPGAHDPEVREWGADRFAAVADQLAKEHGAQVVLLGSGEERAVSDRVAASAREAGPIALTGETSLREALAIISLCKLWVGNDGGLIHAAVALGPATVGIFGPSKAPRWGYDTPRHRTMVVYPGRSDLPATNPKTIRRCLDAITVESVMAECERVLERPS